MGERLESVEIPVYSIREAAKKLGKSWHYLATMIEDHRLPTYPMSTNVKARGLSLKSYLFLERRINRSRSTSVQHDSVKNQSVAS
jgi:hypothetical protein